MTFLIPLLGLRVQRHTGIISVFFADNDDDFYSQSEDNQDLAPDTEIYHVSETQSEIFTDDMGFLNLLDFFWPTCSPGKLKSFGREQAKIFH